jgi:hypothetical protein
MASWHAVYEKVTPYILRIETPVGGGTAFLFATNESKSIVALATAAHVVSHAESWKVPLKLIHHQSGSEIFLEDQDRIIEIDSARDSASILLGRPTGGFLPVEELLMMDSTQFKKAGVEVAWAGYPAIAHPTLCLFTGTIAAFVNHDDSYLIDGVAINGVSGGPVFSAYPDGSPEILGTISAYMPNRLRGDALPGMLQAHDVTTFQATVRRIRSLDEARRQKEEEEQMRRQAEAAGDAPPDPGEEGKREPAT